MDEEIVCIEKANLAMQKWIIENNPKLRGLRLRKVWRIKKHLIWIKVVEATKNLNPH